MSQLAEDPNTSTSSPVFRRQQKERVWTVDDFKRTFGLFRSGAGMDGHDMMISLVEEKFAKELGSINS